MTMWSHLTPSLIVWLVLITISMLFYCFVLGKMYVARHKIPWNSSYFKLWRLLAVIDVLATISVWVIDKIDLSNHPYYIYLDVGDPFNDYIYNGTSWQVEYPIMYTAGIYMIVTPLNVSQYAIVVAMTVNRITSVVWPVKYDHVGCRHILILCKLPRCGLKRRQAALLRDSGWFRFLVQ